MVKAEVKTPIKRKSFANQTPAKKQKLDGGKTPSKLVGPKKGNQTPKKTNQITNEKPNNQQSSSKKLNKRDIKDPSENSSPKKVTQFAGTGQLKGNKSQKKQEKSKNGTAKQAVVEGQKKKRRAQFSGLINQVKSKAGTKDSELLKTIEEKVTAIKSKPELTKTAKRKLSLLHKLKIIIEEGNDTSKKTAEKSQSPKVIQNKTATKAGTGKKQVQKIQQKVEQEDSDDEESEDEEDDDNEEEESAEEEGQSDEEVAENEESDDDENDDEDDDDDDDDDEDDDDESDEAPPVQGDPSQKKVNKTDKNLKEVNLNDLKKSNLMGKGQKRFVLFVGNIPYDTTKQDLLNHFGKAGEIVHIRIPTEKGNNKPRGFGYIEVKDEFTYQKCLSMHHTHLKNRRINVLYTQGGKKKGDSKKNEIKAKNMKLHALRKQGKLAGSVKQTNKRSFRRNKSKVKPENVDS